MNRKINILQFICSTGLYGAEMWILALAKHLDSRKINCQLAVTLESENQDIEIYNRFRSLGLKAHQIRMNGRFDLRVMTRLFRLIRKEKIEIIHTHGYKSDILGLIAARLTGIKAIATPHGFGDSDNIKLKLFTYMGCFALRHFDKVAPLSEKLVSEIARIRVPCQNIRFILNGVDLDEIESARKSISEYQLHPNEKKIVYIGRLIPGKNLENLLNVFDLLYKEYKNIRLMIIGDGPLRDVLEKQASLLPAGNKIEFLGYREDRLILLRECDLFSMTSLSEGIPRCMMEAMAMEIPVAAYDIPGIDKLIIHEKTGLMAELGDTKALKACWERLLFDDKFSKQMALNGKNHVIGNFSAQRMAQEYANLYMAMMN